MTNSDNLARDIRFQATMQWSTVALAPTVQFNGTVTAILNYITGTASSIVFDTTRLLITKM